ncbi:zinc finger, CCHC-type containing protein [Tanacetum coccineum]
MADTYNRIKRQKGLKSGNAPVKRTAALVEDGGHDLKTRKVLGLGKKKAGLYHRLNLPLEQIHAHLSSMAVSALEDFVAPFDVAFVDECALSFRKQLLTVRVDREQRGTSLIRHHSVGAKQMLIPRTSVRGYKQHVKDFHKLMDSLDLEGDNRERTRLRLFQFPFRDQASNWLERLPAGSIIIWEDLTTCFLAQFFPLRRIVKLHNDILMFQKHHGESLSEAWTRFKDLLQKVPHHGIDLWLQVQIFYDHIDCTTQGSIDYAAGGRLRKLRPDEAWDTIKRLSQYENEGWNDSFTPDEVCFNHKNPDIKQLLGIMERKVDTLMKDVISSMEKSKSIFRYEPLHKGVTFRLGGVERENSLLELGWRMGSYSKRESRDVATLSGLRNAETVNATRLTHSFRPSIGRKPPMITKIDLFYLYCIFEEGIVFNIPYWLAKYLKGMGDKSVIFGGMFVTKIAQSFGLLTNELASVLNRESPPHVYRKTSLVKMGVIMELYEGECCWPATRGVAGEGEGDDEEGDGEGGNEGVGGSADIYLHMSQGDWQQDERAHQMYDHTVRQFQHLSTRDNLEPHLQIDPFPGKAHLLEDKQIPSVRVFDEVFHIWKAFGRITRDLGSFGEETDKTTDLHQHLSRISPQRLETASQIQRDAVTMKTKTTSQDSTMTSEIMTQPII